MDMDARRTRVLQAAQKIPIRGQLFLIFAELVGQAGTDGRAKPRTIGNGRTDAQADRADYAPSGAEGVDASQLVVGIRDDQTVIQRFRQILIAFAGGGKQDLIPWNAQNPCRQHFIS